MHGIALHEAALDSEMPIISDKENVIVAPGQGDTPVSLLHDDTCKELALPCLFPKGKFRYSVC